MPLKVQIPRALDRLPLCVLTILMLAVSPSLAQPAKPTASPDDTHEDYATCNVQGFFQAFISKFEKSDFKSAAEKRSSLSAAIRRDFSRYLGHDISCEIASQSTGRLRYDAEDKGITGLYLRDNFLDISSSLVDTGTYTATNRYGHSFVVRKSEEEVYGIKLARIVTDASIPVIPVDAGQAEAQWNDITVALVGSLEEPFIHVDRRDQDATFDRPREIVTRYLGIVMRPRKIVVWNRSTKAILAQVKVQACNDAVGTFGTCLGGRKPGCDPGDDPFGIGSCK